MVFQFKCLTQYAQAAESSQEDSFDPETKLIKNNETTPISAETLGPFCRPKSARRTSA